MIIKHPFEKGLFNRSGTDTLYFGKDAENFLESINWHTDIDYLGKECTTSEGNKGIVIGIEDSQSFDDYYFIVFLPETEKVIYELANSPTFNKSVKV